MQNDIERPGGLSSCGSSQQAVSLVPASIPDAWKAFTEAMTDPEYAWAWHCNLAVPIMDAANITHEQANIAAAHLMQHLWGCDITTHPQYRYEKSRAQSYAEFRIELEAEEDAQAMETSQGGNGVPSQDDSPVHAPDEEQSNAG